MTIIISNTILYTRGIEGANGGQGDILSTIKVKNTTRVDLKYSHHKIEMLIR